MAYLLKRPLRLKDPPWPLDQDVNVKFDDWKYPKIGRIVASTDPNCKSFYFFCYTDARGRRVTRSLSTGIDRFAVTLASCIQWDCFE